MRYVHAEPLETLGRPEDAMHNVLSKSATPLVMAMFCWAPGASPRPLNRTKLAGPPEVANAEVTPVGAVLARRRDSELPLAVSRLPLPSESTNTIQPTDQSLLPVQDGLAASGELLGHADTLTPRRKASLRV